MHQDHVLERRSVDLAGIFAGPLDGEVRALDPGGARYVLLACADAPVEDVLGPVRLDHQVVKAAKAAVHPHGIGGKEELPQLGVRDQEAQRLGGVVAHVERRDDELADDRGPERLHGEHARRAPEAGGADGAQRSVDVHPIAGELVRKGRVVAVLVGDQAAGHLRGLDVRFLEHPLGGDPALEDECGGAPFEDVAVAGGSACEDSELHGAML